MNSVMEYFRGWFGAPRNAAEAAPVRKRITSWLVHASQPGNGHRVAAMARAGYEAHGRGMLVASFHLASLPRYTEKPSEAPYAYVPVKHGGLFPESTKTYSPETQFVFGVTVFLQGSQVLSTSVLVEFTNTDFGSAGFRRDAALAAGAASGAELRAVCAKETIGDDTPRATLTCAVCGENDNVQQCSGCHAIAYCGEKHQLHDWPKHKALCKKMRKARKKAVRKALRKAEAGLDSVD